jgi:hypothetical protein
MKMNRLQIIKPIILLLLTLSATTEILAHKPPTKGGIVESTPVLNSRADCVQGTSRFYMEVNNVRTVLLSSGDVWWDLTKGV